MSHPFSLLVVHGDGSRVLRVYLPRWMAYGTLGLIVAVAAATIGLSGGYVLRLRESGQMAARRQRAEDERMLDAFQARISDVRSEITAWKTLHAKMWKALGREAGSDQVQTAMGDDAPNADPQTVGVQPPPSGELDLLASSVAQEGPRLRELEHVIGQMGKIMNALPLGWPVRGQVHSEYGMRRSPWGRKREHHDGIDIGGLPGTPVMSPAPGTVVAASSQRGYGKNIVLDHGNGVESRYAHLKKIDVKVGQRVEKGDVLGRVGSTGRSTGPHLHYEVIVEGKAVDPRGFLSAR